MTVTMTVTVVPESGPLIRVERGSLAEDELAALTAVLLTRAGGTGPDPGRPAPSGPRWTRPERDAPYHSPTSWRR